MQFTYFFENQVVLQAALAEGMPTESSDTLLDYFEANGTDEFLKGVLFVN